MTLNAAVLAEHEAWKRELTAEIVTHRYESFAEVIARLERERPESPHQRMLRQSREASIANQKEA